MFGIQQMLKEVTIVYESKTKWCKLIICVHTSLFFLLDLTTDFDILLTLIHNYVWLGKVLEYDHIVQIKVNIAMPTASVPNSSVVLVN